MTAAVGAGVTRPVVAPPWVFMPGPLRGTWMRTDLSVLVACPEDNCKADPFELCARNATTKNANVRPLRRSGATHRQRRRAFRADERLMWIQKASLCPVVRVGQVTQ